MKFPEDNTSTRQRPSSEEGKEDAASIKNVDELIEGLMDANRSMRMSPKSPNKCPV
eukprot:CAMPEP_0116109252 /NCGR_PEP_ID=MMETSP0327-20121206/17230_1 /TAXON_ID=44447 /ORGANISM="Pseudo-nitzschia delicatissima, Strain B596" /LENGTH=55 /DNA_ID=CAMNT_0003602239 /DNA_START=86 /DNA_END=249 /DNA_ORIENTATION=+